MLALALIAAAWSIFTQDYSRYVGQVHEFCGDVVTFSYYPASGKSCDVALHLGRPHWKPGVRIIVDAAVREGLAAPPEDFLFQNVCATGIVTREKRFIQVRVSDPGRIRIAQQRLVHPFGLGAHRICGADAKDPIPTREVKPRYTIDAMRASVEGSVSLEAVVTLEGTVTDVRVVYGLHPGLDDQAVKALRSWRFKPAVKAGQPVEAIVQVEMTFTLR